MAGLDGQRAVERLDALAQAGQARAGGVCATHAVVGHLDAQAVAAVLDEHAAVLRARVLGDVRERLHRDEVRGRLDGGGEAIVDPTSSATSTGLRAAIEDSAGPSPRSVRIAG